MANTSRTSFYQQIDQHYGHCVTEKMKQYATAQNKLASMVSRKIFLIECRKKGVYPSHIANSFRCVYSLIEVKSPYLHKLSQHIARFKRSILNIEIQQTFYTIKQLHREISGLKQQITQRTDNEIGKNFMFYQELAYNSALNRRTRTTDKKLKTILYKLDGTSIPSCNEKALFNATKIDLPTETKTLLSLGPKFCLPYTTTSQLPLYHLLADIESIIHTNPDKNVQARTRCLITNTVQNHINSTVTHTADDQLTKFCVAASKTTTTFLKNHPNIRVLPADKGNRTVVMTIDDYKQKMDALLRDENTYQQIPRDPTGAYQYKNNKIVQRLLDLQLIDRRTATTLRTYTATAPKIYGQPKAHKANLPLRPVVPTHTAPNYELSKFVCRILQTATVGNEYDVTDSFSFCTYVNSITLPSDHIMISLDVVSLFTNIPHDLVRKCVIEEWGLMKEHTNICLDLFLEMVEFCMSSSYFQFDGKFYQQISGSAMGNPMSPVCADMVMNLLIRTVSTTIALPEIKKYVDDLFLVVHKDKVQDTVDAFNSFHPMLQFTCEIEKDQKLPYLDMLLIRTSNQNIVTQWYAKPIASGRLLNYKSFHPLQQKINTIVNFIHRVDRLSTTYSQQQKFQIIKKQLKANDYPKQLINRCWRRYSNKPDTANTANAATTTTSPTTYKSIPYIPNLAPRIAKVFRKDYSNITVAFSNRRNVNTLLPPVKDPTPPQQHHNVIYQIPCRDCDSSYIGMTTQLLNKRLSGHQSNINSLEKLLKDGYAYSDDPVLALREKTALLSHCVDTEHRFNLTNSKVIDRSFHSSALPIMEMCHIYNEDCTVNKRTDVEGLNMTYAGLLDTFKKYRNRKHTQQSANTQPSQTRSSNESTNQNDRHSDTVIDISAV